MDALDRSHHTIAAFWQSLPRGQRTSIVLGAAAAVVAIGWMLRPAATPPLVVVSGDAPLPHPELNEAAQHLRDAGLNTFKIDDGRLLAPAAVSEQYQAELSRVKASPQRPIDRWQSTDSLLGQFAGSRRHELERDAARARLIGELLTQLPEVEQAEIVWDEERGAGWRRPPRVRASVYLKPRPGNEISFDTVSAVRLAVSGSKAHLDPADVSVMDLERMVTYTGIDPDETTPQEQLSRLTAAHRSRIEAAVADIDGARVSVVVSNSDEPHRTHEVRFDPATSLPATGLGANPAAQHVTNHGMEVPALFAEANDPAQAPLLDVIVVVPAAYVHQQLAARMPHAAGALPAGQSAAMIKEVEGAIQDSIHERIAGLIASGPQAAVLQSLEVQTEPIAIVDQAGRTESATIGWLTSATAALDLSSWSTWAMFLGLGASLCWWLKDVASWYGWPAASQLQDPEQPPSPSPTVNAIFATSPEFPAEQTSEPLLNGCQVDEPHRGNFSFADQSPTAMEEIVDLSAADLRAVFQAVPVDIWATALRGCSTSVESHLLNSLTPAAASDLRRQLRSARPVRLREIEEAQQSVLSLWAAPSV